MTADGRYKIHELLRQYGVDLLAEAVPEAVTQTSERHSAYYITFLRGHSAGMNSGQQLRAVAEIGAELDNVRTAWHWAVEHRNIPGLAGAANSLVLFCQFRSRYLDGARLLDGCVSV
jgi:hypothetical protein